MLLNALEAMTWICGQQEAAQLGRQMSISRLVQELDAFLRDTWERISHGTTKEKAAATPTKKTKAIWYAIKAFVVLHHVVCGLDKSIDVWLALLLVGGGGVPASYVALGS